MKLLFRLFFCIICVAASGSPSKAEPTEPRGCSAFLNAPLRHGRTDDELGTQLYERCAESVRKHGLSRQAAAPKNNSQQFVIFAVQGSIATFPNAINEEGFIAGSYIDENRLFHSFLRAPNGALLTFDPPGSTCDASHRRCSSTTGINAEGTVVGVFTDTATHSFLRSRRGGFTTLDPPATNGFSSGRVINDDGVIAGIFRNGTDHGYLKNRNGPFISFDPLNSIRTSTDSINDQSEIAGSFTTESPDHTQQDHGFLRYKNGFVVSFDPPDSKSTSANGINAKGVITGFFADSSDRIRSFVRSRGGSITVFDANTTTPQTEAFAINDDDAIIGNYFDEVAGGGFVRTRKGDIIAIDPPGSFLTIPFAINNKGVIVGTFCADDVTCPAFLLLPR